MALKVEQTLFPLIRVFSYPNRVIQAHRRKKIKNWSIELSQLLVDKILPKNTPYQFDAVLSFLQEPPYNLKDPVRLDLFLPEYPLAIDIVGEDGDQDYRIAKKYCSYADWTKIRSRLSVKKFRLEQYRCPYLTINYFEPLDLGSLKDRVNALIDTSPIT